MDDEMLRCAICDEVLPLLMPGDPEVANLDNALTLTMTGGYAEFIDSAFMEQPPSVLVCHACGHVLMDLLRIPRDEVRRWHPDSGDHWCGGW